jgi:ABC-type transport system involved in multi-copper enzyme maturation permease subunit
VTPTGALAWKAWLETRARFATGLAAVLAVCGFMTLMRPYIVAQWRSDLVEHPEWQNPIWFDDVLNDYRFYLWHYLYDDMLQKTLVIFAVLLGVGGLAREGVAGTAGFTLGLPAARGRLLAVRAAVSAAELAALAAVAVCVIAAGSFVVGEVYPLGHAILHLALILAGSLVILGASLALSAWVEGEYAPVLIGLSAVTLFYFLASPYSDGGDQPGLVRALNLAAVMAGGPGAAAVDIPWLGLAVAGMAGAGAGWLAFRRTRSSDY